MLKKIFGLFVTLTIIFSSISSVSAQVSDSRYQELKELAIQMITPTYGNVADEDFRIDVREMDKEITRKFNSLTSSEKEIVLNLVRNNGEEFSLSSFYRAALDGGRCGYQVFPNRAIIKDPVTKGNANIHYGTFTSAVSNNPRGEFPCDNQIWYSTSKPNLWGTTWRARTILNLHGTVNKRTDWGKDSIIIGGKTAMPFYGYEWMGMHNEFIIWD